MEKIPVFSWDTFKNSLPQYNKRRVEVIEYVSISIKETIEEIQKLHPNIYVFYSEDEYNYHCSYINKFIETCKLDLQIKLNHYIYSSNFKEVYICSENLEIK